MNRIEYRLTEQDLLLFNLYFAEHSEHLRKQRRRHRLLVPAAYLILAFMLLLVQAYVVAAAFILFAAGWFLFAPRLMKARYRTIYGRHLNETIGDSLRDPLTLELQPDGIATTSFLGESKYRYAAVDRIAEHDGYTYVFIGKGMALVLPHDRIPRETIAALAAEIIRKKQEANQAVALPPMTND